MTTFAISDIPRFGPTLSPRNHGECLRVARVWRSEGLAAVGLFPIGERAAVPPVALQIARALVEVGGEAVALVDANVRLPAFRLPDAAPMPQLDSETDAQVSLFRRLQLEPKLDLLAPGSAAEAGAGVPQLAALVEGKGRYAHLLVDLTGFDRIGDHLSAVALLDGVAFVGRSGVSREAQLLRLRREFPPQKVLGVLLVG